ncbi:hypothetical protein BpHYR1_027370 [Brachionus plicatilis]|uniref:Uncharacterized protein n=1 Tax=Brachionus plicatilis TaxID=10195 RepID=A0A3M7PQP9_BRAPC|nr:hypothetical protein BpHYR1_027370 [Brachionus plicatilis]
MAQLFFKLIFIEQNCSDPKICCNFTLPKFSNILFLEYLNELLNEYFSNKSISDRHVEVYDQMIKCSIKKQPAQNYTILPNFFLISFNTSDSVFVSIVFFSALAPLSFKSLSSIYSKISLSKTMKFGLGEANANSATFISAFLSSSLSLFVPSSSFSCLSGNLPIFANKISFSRFLITFRCSERFDSFKK